MERDLCERVPISCPACERKLTLAEVSLLDSDQRVIHGTLKCACPREHPIIDGVPIIVPNLSTYLPGERQSILRRHDLPGWADDLLDLAVEDPDAERWRARTITTYAATPSQDSALVSLSAALPQFVEEVLSRHPHGSKLGLDAGAAAGVLTRLLAKHVQHAVGLELAFDRVRRAREDSLHQKPPVSFIAGLAENPPFSPGSFDVVLALNLLDVVAKPKTLLDKLAICLAPGGLLILTTPFEYSTALTTLEDRIDGQELVPTLADRFEILDDLPRIPWHLPISERHHDIYFVRGIVARKS